jgi:hypothetical protein
MALYVGNLRDDHARVTVTARRSRMLGGARRSLAGRERG